MMDGVYDADKAAADFAAVLARMSAGPSGADRALKLADAIKVELLRWDLNCDNAAIDPADQMIALCEVLTRFIATSFEPHLHEQIARQMGHSIADGLGRFAQMDKGDVILTVAPVTGGRA